MSDELDKLEAFRIAIEGRDGTNGKLGNLRADVAGIKKALLAVGITALSALGGAAASAWHAASEAGADKATLNRAVEDVAHCQSDVNSLRSTVWSALLHLPGATP